MQYVFHNCNVLIIINKNNMVLTISHFVQEKLVRIIASALLFCTSSVHKLQGLAPVVEVFFQPEQADDGFTVVNFALPDPLYPFGK